MAVLLVVTNCGEISSIKHKTGWYLPEVAHPYKLFKDAGVSMTIVSPLGGKAPLVSALDRLVNFV
jgi:putative intracellular protease/amidase